MRQRAVVGSALFIGIAGVALGAMVSRADIAQAMGLHHSAGAAQALPGNTVQRAATNAKGITQGGGWLFTDCTGTNQLGTPRTASAIAIHMSTSVAYLTLYMGDAQHTVAGFAGPSEGGAADVQYSLAKPITFDQIGCSSFGSGSYSVSWVGSK